MPLFPTFHDFLIPSNCSLKEAFPHVMLTCEHEVRTRKIKLGGKSG